MPPVRTRASDLASDRTTETPEPTPWKVAPEGKVNVIYDLTISSSESEDDSEIEIIPIPHSHQPRVPPKRKSIGTLQHLCAVLPSTQLSPAAKPAAQPRPRSFTISGTVLRPTEVFDTFWRFAAERKIIDDKRRSGAPFPWTEDRILQRYPFCNTYRVLDKLCQYLIREVIEKGSQDPEEVTFRVILFNTFTRIETWELLDHELGPLTWATYNRAKYQRVLSRAKNDGMSLYTGSFIKPAPHFGYSDNFMNHLCLLEMFMEHGFASRVMGAKYLADVFEYIAAFPSMGDFTTYQLMLNLSYSNVLNFHPNDFVVPGPGALSGLCKMFGRGFNGGRTSASGFGIEVIRWLVQTQDQHFKRLGIQFSGLGPEKRPMDVADIEHVVCEVDKYSRLAHPQYKGKRTEIRRVFEPSDAPYPSKAYFPKAWSHPDRKIPRVRPGGPPVVEKRYMINRIGGQRQGENGVEYFVYWFGYPDSDATWEPEALLLEDAPLAVEEYLGQQVLMLKAAHRDIVDICLRAYPPCCCRGAKKKTDLLSVMESIHRLREALLRVLSGHESSQVDQELFDELVIQKPRLLKVLDVGPRSQEERREIESGKIVINGRRVAVNADFERQVIFLSEQLECSERYIASLLQSVTAENPNIAPINCIEVTVAQFHQRRRCLVDSLQYLFEAAEAAENPDASPTYDRIGQFVRSELLIPEIVGGGEIALAYRIFREIENMDSVIARAHVARRNAGSNTVAPSAQGTGALGYDILTARCESLKYERRHLAMCLCLIARMGYFSPNEIKTFVDWLSTNPNHAMTYYILTAILLAFDPADPGSFQGGIRRDLATENTVMAYMTKKLSAATEWKDIGLKAVILLKWTLLLTEVRHGDSSLEHRSGFRTEELEMQIWNAVQGDAFSFLALSVMQIQKKRGLVQCPPLLSTLSIPSEQQEQRDVPHDNLKVVLLSAFETLIRSLITHASSELRKIKQRQEDLVLANVRTDRARSASTRFASTLAAESTRTGPPPRNDIAILYSFIGFLYASLPPESALQFWGSGSSRNLTYMESVEASAGRLPAFLQWSVWSTSANDLTMMTALYDMLCGLAKGQHCSELAYNFMARGGGEVIPGSMLPSSSTGGPSISWSLVFGILDSWAASASAPRGQTHGQNLGLGPSLGGFDRHLASSSSQFTIGPKEVLLAQAFLQLLATVVTYSVTVRITISGHVHFRAIPTLVSLIPLSIPLELKGALYDTLAAFCEPGAGVPGVEICKAVWTLMERLEVINVRTSMAGGYGIALPAVKGVEVELEEIEAAHKMYPATIPFLKLLSTLIHTPKRIPLKDRVANSEPINTVPENLGQPYRLPGVGPFTSFIIDNVFANISNREYSRPSDRWQTNDLCLCYIERAVASFDLESLVSITDEVPLKGETLIPLLVHPGYDVMKRLLSNSPLQSSVLSYIVEGVEGFEKELSEEEPFFRSTIVRVLRIVHRVLEIQEIFLEVLVPLLSDMDSTTIVGTVHPRSYYTRLDQALSFGPQYIPALAAYVTFPAHAELVMLSIKIISTLSSSPLCSNLMSLISRSNDSERILGGFVQVLASESLEDVAQAETVAEQSTGAGAPESEDQQELLQQAVRLAALDLFIRNTHPSRSYPNIAHYLLFGGSGSEQQIQDPHALGARQTSVHVILDLLNAGVPRLKMKGKERDRRSRQTVPLFITLPGLAEKCYRVIYQLCVHSRTSDFTTRYLRTREDFFARQLANIPTLIPETLQDPYIEVLFSDGSRCTTTVPAMGSFLRLRSCIFELVALELHILSSKGHFKGISELLDILFGSESEFDEDTLVEDGALQPFHELGQSHMRVIEFLQSLMFDWSDSLSVKPVEMQFLGQLHLPSCIRKDATGCDIVDRTAVLSLLESAKRSLYAQGRIVTPVQADQLAQETAYILESCAIENHRREVTHSVAVSYQAWRQLLDMALTKCFDRMPHDRRENMLFDLLHVLPNAVQSPNIEEPTAVLLAETILTSITKLREDRRYQVVLQSAGGESGSSSLPAERLYAILHAMLQGIIDNNRVELVRGNLYAALVNYVHLIIPCSTSDSHSMKTNDSTVPLSSSMSREDFVFGSSQSLVPLAGYGASSSSLESGSLSLMKGVMERLVIIIARDAIDGTEVWRTIAFMLLDALAQLSGSEKQHVLLSALTRHGILANFVRGIKESDARLQSVLKPDPDDLNPLYVYEAKMSFFIRLTQTRAGAERLLEAQVLSVLSRCDYLDATPEADQAFMDRDSFLPSAIQRYHQLLMPALQLVDGMLAMLGTKHSTVMNQAMEFLTSHSDTIVILLKNEPAYVSQTLLDELHLVIALCANVMPSVPKTEMLSTNTGFGAIHAAVLNLSTRCLAYGRCFGNVVPYTDVEEQDATTPAFGYGTHSKFDLSVAQKEQLVRKGIVEYLGTASDFTEPQINLVLTPVTTSPTRQESRGTTFLARIPTIGDAVEALNDLCNSLAEVLKQISDLSAELATKEHIGVENLLEVVRDVHPTTLQELDVAQKRILISQELERIRGRTRREARTQLGTMEMLLLLTWRHIEYYCDPETAGRGDTWKGSLSASHTMSTALRFLASPPEPEVFKAEVGKRLAPVLQKLTSLSVQDIESFGDDWQANQAYIEIMCRRLKDSAGLHDEGAQPLE
ncbi:hypothetical protein AX17_003010 [Amanita inopinata Kibby_2008]|nr:hypothetical protein AX17_003010 [Amanita inopinata Kibby_2008]